MIEPVQTELMCEACGKVAADINFTSSFEPISAKGKAALAAATHEFALCLGCAKSTGQAVGSSLEDDAPDVKAVLDRF